MNTESRQKREGGIGQEGPKSTKVFGEFSRYNATRAQLLSLRVVLTSSMNTYGDHLGNVAAVADSVGVYVPNSYAVHEPFGAFLTTTTGTNPGVTNHGFTGHRHNNLAPSWLGLVYMNARYYHPQLGRLVVLGG